MLLVLLAAAAALPLSPNPWPPLPHCDILIAGGSTAALAAAITAAEADQSLAVCLAEPTDWPGGQMTASGVPALDFGSLNRLPENQPQSFRDLMRFLHEQKPPGCWVSTTCYEPQRMVNGWVIPRIRASSNLHLLERTVVKAANHKITGGLASLQMVQRRARAGVQEWVLLSETIDDWYSPVPSSRFEKRWANLTASVFIDATEFGDVLLTAGLATGKL